MLSLAALRMAMVVLLLHEVPKVTDYFNWYFNHGGDHVLYFQMAQDLVAGTPRPSTVGVGWPLIMAVLILFTGGQEYADILPIIVLFGGIVLGSLSVVLMAALTRQLTGSRGLAFVAALLWTLLPYMLWAGFLIHPQAVALQNAYVPRQMWVTGITDGPSLLLLLAGLWLTAKCRKATRQRLWLVLAGVCFGYAVAIRIHVLPVVAVAVAALAINRQWRGILWLVLGSALGFAPQLWHNSVANYHIINTPYLSGWVGFTYNGEFYFNVRGTPFAPAYLIENVLLLARRLPLVVLTGLLSVAVGIWSFVVAWRRQGSFSAVVLFGAPLASLALHIITFVYAEDPVRFTLPAVSLGIPAAVFTLNSLAQLSASVIGKKGK